MALTAKNQDVTKIKAKKGFANFLFWWGAIFTGFGVLALLTEPADRLPSLMTGFLIIGAAPLVIGYKLRRDIGKKLEESRNRSLEREILTIARREKGVLTAAGIAANSDLSVEEVRNELERMVARGLAYPEANDRGYVEFKFPEFLPKERGLKS
ncbi:MAG: hypothetical protein ACLFQX_12915 [Candidatus Kapaibacterium sp.]